MRTTVTLPNDLLAAAKRRAAEEKVSLSKVVADALRDRLMRRSPPAPVSEFKLITFGQGGLLPGLSFERLKDALGDEEAERHRRATTMPPDDAR